MIRWSCAIRIESMQIRIDIKHNVCESIVHIIEKVKEMGYFGEDTEPELQNTSDLVFKFVC